MGESIKVKTGISGFDSVISGGFRQGQTIVVSGSIGSGKTTFGIQFLYSGAKDFEEPGIFVTLSQSPSEIKNDFKSFGWDVQKLIEEGKMIIIDARPFKKEEGFIAFDESLYRGEQMPFMHLTQLILSSIKRIGAKRLVLDSLSVLEMQYTDDFYIRQGLQGMIYALEGQNCTSILLSQSELPDKVHVEWYIASGLIMLYRVRKGDAMERSIQVVKLQGMKHSEQVFPMKLNELGLQIMHPRIST
ncbi:putative circadian clock protein KaiC [Nitrosotalea sinensis]|uniref:Putative circadian clock protein KaiC n=1 Tax=Nitrosotalea sinensis TaxID=1499975 RepID=A0A2H1EIN3_9ARCH|nr:ATPase domain-containing protein [Candidatus Nitrosotalea sinensis]SHO46754.1 putative circadian clock protein KaiC [Candidatus Nitrosotalea sinensis]